MDEQRSRETRARAELALVRLLHALGDDNVFLYDLVYVLQHNRAGGPEHAARRLLNGEFAADLNSLKTTFLEVRERYVGTTDSGPVGYAKQALEVQPEVGEKELRADAVDVVQRFFAELDA
ncbi:MAG TPA: hypothetical protein VFG58_06775 [Solirubrobacterales bacterium]|nr:hypothetical protein [Solirubrobacterales bacterium]